MPYAIPDQIPQPFPLFIALSITPTPGFYLKPKLNKGENKTEPHLKHRDDPLPTLDVLPFPTRLKNLHTLPSHTLLIFVISISKS